MYDREWFPSFVGGFVSGVQATEHATDDAGYNTERDTAFPARTGDESAEYFALNVFHHHEDFGIVGRHI